MPLNYTSKDLTFIIHQGGEMNRRVKIGRLVYLNKVYAMAKFHYQEALNNLLIYHWYYQQELINVPEDYLTLFHWHSTQRLSGCSQSPTLGTTIQERYGQTEKGPNQGCKGGHRLENTLHKERLKDLHIFSVEKRMLRGVLITVFQYLKSTYNEDRLLDKESCGEGKWQWI